MPEIVFVRHAPTTWSGRRFCGRADPPLSRAGRLVARRVATELATTLASTSLGEGRLISSPARRALETARAIAAALPGLRLELDERWLEVDVGDAEGRTFHDFARAHPVIAERLGRGETAIDWPDGESAASLADRVGSALRDLAHGSSPAIVVAHGGPLRVAIARAKVVPVDSVAFLEPGAFVRVAEPVVA